MKKMLRDWILTVGVRQNKKKHMFSKFQMVTRDSCQCMKRTKQSTDYDIGVRHVSYTVTGCGFIARYATGKHYDVLRNKYQIADL